MKAKALLAMIVIAASSVGLSLAASAPAGSQDGHQLGDSYKNSEWKIADIQGHIPWDWEPLSSSELNGMFNHSLRVSLNGYPTISDCADPGVWNRMLGRLRPDQTLICPSYPVAGTQLHRMPDGSLKMPYGYSQPGDPVVCFKKPEGILTLTRTGQRRVLTFWKAYHVGNIWSNCGRCWNPYNVQTSVVTDVCENVPIPVKPVSNEVISSVVITNIQYFQVCEEAPKQEEETVIVPQYNGWYQAPGQDTEIMPLSLGGVSVFTTTAGTFVPQTPVCVGSPPNLNIPPIFNTPPVTTTPPDRPIFGPYDPNSGVKPPMLDPPSGTPGSGQERPS